ncbi:MAG: LysM peptidoglycan-binding domain-containing protein [Kiritimatiellae bacterium]|nr:LysM peptidoglycan-binding domain-containing protein [Kiritimatiellia bacterium]
MLKILLYTIAILLVLASGCGRGGISEFEKNERENALFSQAINAEKVGDIAEAIKLYKQAMIDEPKAYSAHFMLATLLQDHAEDYIAAIYHYKRYIELQPKSEKVTLAEQRIKISERLLAPKILRSVGDSATGISEVHLLKQNTRLNGIIAKLEGENSKLIAQGQSNEAMVKELMSENARLRKILSQVRGGSVAELPASALTESVKGLRGTAEEGKTGYSKQELEALRKEAAEMKAGASPQPVQRPVVDVPSVRSVLEKVQTRLTGEDAEKKKQESNKAVREAAKQGDLSEFSLFRAPSDKTKADKAENLRTYVVQPGDTLMRISTRFYGDTASWKRIRDANRTQIDPDGRVRAGQIIVIP